jgi:hypothetical protein
MQTKRRRRHGRSALALTIAIVAGLGAAKADAQQRMLSQSAEQSCKGMQAPTFRVNNFAEPVAHRHQRSVGDLTRTSKASKTRQTASSHTLGLTSHTFDYNVETKWMTVTDSKHVCNAIAEIVITVGLSKRVVDIAADLPQGTCIHGEVLAHEHRHVKTAEDVLVAGTPSVSAALSGAASQLRPALFRIGDDAAAAEWRGKSVEWIRDRVGTAVGAMNKEEARRQELIDTPEEYKRLGTVCNGEAMRYVRKR